MSKNRDVHAPVGSRPLHRGRRLALAIEALGEALVSTGALPDAGCTKMARSLADGRSTVPADDCDVDFPARVRERLARGSETESPSTQVRALHSWLGDSLTRWLVAALHQAPLPGWAPAVLSALDLATAARADAIDGGAPLSAAYATWHGEGHDDATKRVFVCASRLGLEEAVDRWCALGCEGDFERYVGTWQRAASGWAEDVLGTRIDVAASDAGRLRALQTALRELRHEVPPPRSLARALAAKLDLSVSEVERLLALESKVQEATNPQRTVRRRWAIVKPIADATAALERELKRLPSVSEIAARAGVHPVLVELAMDALGD
jgi:hypothetical protein